MQWFLLTVWQRPRTLASYQSDAIKISCEEVIDYNDEDGDAIVIALSKAKQQFNLVQEFLNVLPKSIPPDLPPLRNINHHIDHK